MAKVPERIVRGGIQMITMPALAKHTGVSTSTIDTMVREGAIRARWVKKMPKSRSVRYANLAQAIQAVKQRKGDSLRFARRMLEATLKREGALHAEAAKACTQQDQWITIQEASTLTNLTTTLLTKWCRERWLPCYQAAAVGAYRPRIAAYRPAVVAMAALYRDHSATAQSPASFVDESGTEWVDKNTFAALTSVHRNTVLRLLQRNILPSCTAAPVRGPQGRVYLPKKRALRIYRGYIKKYGTLKQGGSLPAGYVDVRDIHRLHPPFNRAFVQQLVDAGTMPTTTLSIPGIKTTRVIAKQGDALRILSRHWPTDYITRTEAAKLAGITRQRIEQLIKKGQLRTMPSPASATKILVCKQDVLDRVRGSNGQAS